MKKILFAIALTACASSAFAAISGSKHDFVGGDAANVTAYGTAVLGTTSCQFCHTPHKASTTNAAAPLWNRADLAAGVLFTMYDSTKISATVAGAPGSASLTCLSCHEGSVAIGQTLNSATSLLSDEQRHRRHRHDEGRDEPERRSPRRDHVPDPRRHEQVPGRQLHRGRELHALRQQGRVRDLPRPARSDERELPPLGGGGPLQRVPPRQVTGTIAQA